MLNLYASAPGALIKVRGASVSYGWGGNEFTSYQCHKTAHTVSNVIIKNIVCDAAKTSYHGTIYIDRDAAHADAMQENKNLLLSSCARASSLPEIEALHHNVRCAHGSAVGQLDDEQLFYMQTRRLHKQSAQRMLVEGFLSDVCEVVDKGVCKMIQARILDALSVIENKK